jgi:CHASE2 domain-containing sensor protein
MPIWLRLRTLLGPLARKGAGHWLRMFLLLAGGYFAGHLLSEGEWLTQLRYSVYFQQLKLQHRGELYPQRTALVLLGDEDYWSDLFEGRKPLKRDRLAQLFDRLNQAGVNTVVVDFDLRSPLLDKPDYEFPSYRDEDAQLLAAVDRMCKAGRHVVLASAVLAGADDDHYREAPSIYTAKRDQLPCLASGYINLPDDMRLLPGPVDLDGGGHLDSLSLAAVKIADPIIYAEIAAQDQRSFRFTRFLTWADFATRNGRQFVYSTQELRNDDLATLHAQLADRIIFVGAHWHTLGYGQGPYVDQFNSPGGVLPGVMLHVNYVEAMLDRTGTFTRVSNLMAEVLEGLLVLVLGIIGALNIHASWKWGAFAGGLLLSIVFTYVLLQNLGIFLDFFIPLLMIVVHTFVEEILHMRHELHHHRKAHSARERDHGILHRPDRPE